MARKTGLQSLKQERREYHDRVINFFNEQGDASFNYKQVSAAVGANTPKRRTIIVEILDQLAGDGFLIQVGMGSYKSAGRSSVAEGIFIRRSNGKNSVDTATDDGRPIMVAERNSMHALNGDRVLVHISAARHGLEPEAEVVKILERKQQVFVGTLQVMKYFAQLATDSKFLATDIFIPLDKLAGGKTGDKAVVKIVDWPEDANSPIGEVVDVLGVAGENNAEIHAILAEFGLPYKYPENVTEAAEALDAGITPEEIAKRRDMRDVTTLTIDPADAKDFDDALSIRKLENGNWEIGVHIADVSHYVTPGSIIDKEAYERATSVYLVDRTVPMLPEKLCNNICSLRPDEDKLTHSVVMEMDAEAKVKKYKICHTVTRSNRRFSYEEAQHILETGKGDLAEELAVLNEMAKQLRSRRFEEGGSVSFNREEIKFDIDETGKPIAVHVHEAKDANKLIEEFMLLANCKVAEHIGKVAKNRTAKAFVYRVHDQPDLDKLQNFADIAAHFGYKVRTKGSGRDINKSINKMLEQAKGKPEEEMLAILAIRSMAKAVYSATNIGHYGLAFDYYTHFTSPIRRYPDLMVHRLLERYLEGGASVNRDEYEDYCKHCSIMEKKAADAERTSIKYKQAEFLADKLGQVFPALISGVSKWGIYAEIEGNKCEGMIPIGSLKDDYYMLDEDNYQVIGRRHGRTYKLGYPVNIRVRRVDMLKKQIDFDLVEEGEGKGESGKRKGESGKRKGVSGKRKVERGKRKGGNKR